MYHTNLLLGEDLEMETALEAGLNKHLALHDVVLRAVENGDLNELKDGYWGKKNEK